VKITNKGGYFNNAVMFRKAVPYLRRWVSRIIGKAMQRIAKT